MIEPNFYILALHFIHNAYLTKILKFMRNKSKEHKWTGANYQEQQQNYFVTSLIRFPPFTNGNQDCPFSIRHPMDTFKKLG